MIGRVGKTLCLVTAAATLGGCSESVVIKSYPPGAKAFVDGQYIGSTPAAMNIPRASVGAPHPWRVEYRDCDQAEGSLETGVAKGRIVAYIFTLGIFAIFRGPYYYPQVDAILNGGDCEAPKRTGAAIPPGITIQQIVGDHNAPSSGSEISKTQKVAERLTTLRDLYNRKLISQADYDSEKAKAVKELSE